MTVTKAKTSEELVRAKTQVLAALEEKERAERELDSRIAGMRTAIHRARIAGWTAKEIAAWIGVTEGRIGQIAPLGR